MNDAEALKAAQDKIAELKAIVMALPIRALGNCEGCPYRPKYGKSAANGVVHERGYGPGDGDSHIVPPEEEPK